MDNRIKISSKDGTITGYYLFSGKVIINAGSYFREIETNSIRNNIKIIRNYLKTNNYIKDNILVKSFTFDSPSTAIDVMLGRMDSGMRIFYSIDNISLGDFIQSLSNNRENIEKDDEEGIVSSNDMFDEYSNNFLDKPESKPELISISNNKYKRDVNRSKNALYLANFKCDLNHDHISFITKKGNVYMEAHHLIPLSKQSDFEVSLDVEANIVCLCPNCHRQLHYGKNVASLITKLYNDRKERLEKSGIYITLEELLKYYN